MERAIRSTARYGIVALKKTILKNPQLKNSIKRVLMAQLSPTVQHYGYDKWLDENFPDFIELHKLKSKYDDLKNQPLISIIVPTYNTDLTFLRDCLDSVLAQIYENWELCIVDDSSPNQNVRDLIVEYAVSEKRIKYVFLDTNLHIAGATNEAVKLATGAYISLLDHDDILWPNALYEVALAINNDPELDLIYTDEDKITENRHEHLGPFFKPDWNPDFLHSVNYITHFTTLRKSIYQQVGGLRKEYNGAQDWDLFMRITHVTKNIYHIPKVLYSWRVHDLSTAKNTNAKPYVVEAQKRALEDDCITKGYAPAVVEQDAKHLGYWNVTYPIADTPLVSIVVPSKNQYRIVKRCVESIYKKSTYTNFEVILVDTGSTEINLKKW